ncbi:MAG: dihydrofolate reductase [Chloroflexi bacterium]|nr:MAG: dihydrofolate reductase [Chloroflexota bacterium]
MRRIVAGLFISLDGVAENPGEWQIDLMDDEAGADVGRGLEEADTILLGRRTFEEFAAYWPSAPADDPFSAYINNTPKLVVSNTLTSVDWQNSSIISGDVSGQLSALKEQDGKNLGITGSLTLVRSLLRDGLLDELRLQVYPIVLGKGKRLFDDSIDKLPMKLVDSKITSKGIAILHYQPAPS